MNAHRVETRLEENGTLILSDLPFEAGASVEVIVLEANGMHHANDASTSALPKEGENGMENFIRAIDEFWEREGERPDIPRDWSQNFDKYKPSLFRSREEEDGS